MLVLKIIFGIIVTLPILFLAEYLFEKTVEDALVGTTAKKKIPFLRRIFPGRRKKRRRKHGKDEEQPEPNEYLSDYRGDDDINE